MNHVLLLASCLVAGASLLHAEMPAPAVRQMREDALQRPRRIIWNHDGGGSIALTKETLPDFLNRGRPLTPLVDTQVDTIMFCSSSDFGTSLHFTKVGQLVESNFLTSRPIAVDPTKRGSYLDPLKVVVDFGHQHGMEVFWSMRMNDTHDGGKHEASPARLAANTFKQAHPEWLRGSKDNPPFHGIWTGVNYEEPGVREYVFRLSQEVCQDYDIDGMEFDFFRHPNFFKNSGPGVAVSQAQCDLITDLLRKIRGMADAEGQKRGRAILIAVKAPDSLGYAKAVGLDIERWLSDGLVDLLIPGGYIRMNDWSASVELGHRYGVKVYPSLDDPRLTPPGKALDASQALRITDAAYRGRAWEAFAAKADGVYLFNFFSTNLLKFPKNVFSEMGDPKTLANMPRTYFGSYLGLGKIAGGGFPHESFQKIETLSPTNPKAIALEETASAGVNIPEVVPSDANVVAALRFDTVPNHIKARINGYELTSPTRDSNWLRFSCKPSFLKQGLNLVDVSQTTSPVRWQDLAIEIQPAK